MVPVSVTIILLILRNIFPGEKDNFAVKRPFEFKNLQLPYLSENQLTYVTLQYFSTIMLYIAMSKS